MLQCRALPLSLTLRYATFNLSYSVQVASEHVYHSNSHSIISNTFAVYKQVAASSTFPNLYGCGASKPQQSAVQGLLVSTQGNDSNILTGDSTFSQAPMPNSCMSSVVLNSFRMV
jgi:hypothetical protein